MNMNNNTINIIRTSLALTSVTLYTPIFIISSLILTILAIIGIALCTMTLVGLLCVWVIFCFYCAGISKLLSNYPTIWNIVKGNKKAPSTDIVKEA